MFHSKPPAATNPAGLGEGFPYRERPAWMREGIEPYPLGGHESLEVVGESFRQIELRRLTGFRPVGERVPSVKIRAALVAENGNSEDPDAVAVWIKDPQGVYLLVGYLSREAARLYRPGLLAQERSIGRPVALAGVITGGGMRADGPGMLGVFLRHNPADFTDPARLVPPRWVPPVPASQMRTVLSNARVTDGSPGIDDSYNLAWMADLPGFDIRAVPMLRKLLNSETRPLSRHYMYQRLEDMLYWARDAFASALGEYDEACRQHDREMGRIRQACIEKWGEVPHLDTYRQMTIRQQKARNLEQALWWAERGIALYGDQARWQESVEDLRHRAATYRSKLGQAAPPVLSPHRQRARHLRHRARGTGLAAERPASRSQRDARGRLGVTEPDCRALAPCRCTPAGRRSRRAHPGAGPAQRLRRAGAGSTG
jgi:hypothetical protein